MSYTICPGSSDPFYVVNYYIKRVTTSWTYSRFLGQNNIYKTNLPKQLWKDLFPEEKTKFLIAEA